MALRVTPGDPGPMTPIAGMLLHKIIVVDVELRGSSFDRIIILTSNDHP